MLWQCWIAKRNIQCSSFCWYWYWKHRCPRQFQTLMSCWPIRHFQRMRHPGMLGLAWSRVWQFVKLLPFYVTICIYGFICLPWVFYDSLNFIDIQALFLCLRLCHEEWETMVHGTDLNVSKHHWLAACDVGMLWLKKTFIEILPVHVIFRNLFTPTRELPFRYGRDQWTCRHLGPVDWKVDTQKFHEISLRAVLSRFQNISNQRSNIFPDLWRPFFLAPQKKCPNKVRAVELQDLSLWNILSWISCTRFEVQLQDTSSIATASQRKSSEGPKA